jgi:hypothetical protein
VIINHVFTSLLKERSITRSILIIFTIELKCRFRLNRMRRNKNFSSVCEISKNDHLKIRVVNLMKIRRWDVWIWWKNEQSDEKLIKMKNMIKISRFESIRSRTTEWECWDMIRIYQSTSSFLCFSVFNFINGTTLYKWVVFS